MLGQQKLTADDSAATCGPDPEISPNGKYQEMRGRQISPAWDVRIVGLAESG